MKSVYRATIIALSLIPVILGVVLLAPRRPVNRVYRIGWENDAPDQLAGPNGEPTGLAVEVVREAARRRHIRLQWVRCDESSEAALRGKRVDLWPLMTITPAREKVLHFSTPYLESVISLLVRKNDSYRRVEDLAKADVTYLRLPINLITARQHLPEAHLIPVATPRELVESVCRHNAAAAYIEEDSIITDVMSGASCPNEPLGVIGIPEAHIRLGVASRFAHAVVADTIREEIDSMLIEGRLAELIAHWGYLSTRSVQSVEALRQARRRARWLAAATAVFAFSLVLALWLSFRYRRAEQALRKNIAASRKMEERVRLMAQALRSTQDCISITDVQNHILYVNDAFLRTYGYEAAELIGKHIDVVRASRHRESLAGEIIEQPANDGWRGEVWNRSKSGSEFPVSLTTSGVRDDNGEIIALVGVASDISERKQAEDALRESERRFRELLKTVNLAAVMVDLQGRITFCNDYFLRTTGWTREEAIGRPMEELLAPEHRAAHSEALRNAVATRHAPPFMENAVLTANGKTRWIEWNNTVLRDPNGQPAGIASIGADLTEHRALKDQYLQSQKLESIGRLAGGVAHDFNNLLTVINGYSAIMAGRLPAGDPLRPHCEQIRHAGNRAAALTQQLLAFSRKQVSQPEPLDLNALVTESEEMLRRLVGEDVSLLTILQPRIGKVMADAGQMHQVLMNLVVNARDAMPDGGRLTIKTAAITLDPHTAADNPELAPGSYVLLSVSDDGLGMDDETRLRIFEPFYTTKPKGKGTGLGLSTVYGIVRQSQGWVTVESAPGKGSAFRVYLPDTGCLDRKEPDRELTAHTRGSETVLVVEDQEGVRCLVADILKEDGYRVLTARDGQSALALALSQSQPIALVLTDVVMPGMNGRQLVDRLKEATPDLKVLFMSGHAENVIAHRGVLERGVALIPKPFTPVSLTNRIREILDA